jgi:hypothetical protein
MLIDTAKNVTFHDLANQVLRVPYLDQSNPKLNNFLVLFGMKLDDLSIFDGMVDCVDLFAPGKNIS